MKGIDISGWQKGIQLDKIDLDFVIIKATQGTTIDSLEQEVTDTEIMNMRQEQSITDNEMAIVKLTDKVGSTTADTKEA